LIGSFFFKTELELLKDICLRNQEIQMFHFYIIAVFHLS